METLTHFQAVCPRSAAARITKLLRVVPAFVWRAVNMEPGRNKQILRMLVLETLVLK